MEAAREVVKDLRHLDGYRFVYGQRSVSVRRSDSARAVVVGFLPAGSTVEVLEVRGASTRIEWKAADGQATVAGWVFTRYLRRFQ